MKKISVTFFTVALLVVCLSACGWKPEVPAVTVTAPWNAMNLPIKSNAVVWKSEPAEFRAVHKEDKRTILKNYTEALKGQGWTLGDFKEEGDRFLVDMTKDGEPLRLEVYDFDNTGVVLKKEGEMV